MKVMLDSNAFVPERAHDTDAGLDIKSPVSKFIPVNGSAVIRTGVHIELPHGYAGILVSKSGLNVMHGITSTGLIDEGYTGEIVVKLYNNGEHSYLVERGDKISQLVIVPVAYEKIELVSEFSKTARGNNGFGSSGK